MRPRQRRQARRILRQMIVEHIDIHGSDCDTGECIQAVRQQFEDEFGGVISFDPSVILQIIQLLVPLIKLLIELFGDAEPAPE